jgi:hypothetical protein
MSVSIDVIVKVIVVLIWLLGVYYLLRNLKNVRSPVKERIIDAGTIGIIIFACGAVFHKFELTVAGSLIWAYGMLLLLAEEYRKGKEESKRKKI